MRRCLRSLRAQIPLPHYHQCTLRSELQRCARLKLTQGKSRHFFVCVFVYLCELRFAVIANIQYIEREKGMVSFAPAFLLVLVC